MKKPLNSVFSNPNLRPPNETVSFDNEPTAPNKDALTGIRIFDSSEIIYKHIKNTEDRAEKAEASADYYEKKSMVDSLTGAYTRNRFVDFVEKEFNPDQTKVAIVAFDVTGLKIVNDKWGHAAGDELLIRMAKSLSCLGFCQSDFLVRCGGDEFVFVYAQDNGQAQDIEKIKNQINTVKAEFESSFDEYCKEVGHNYKANISYGLAFFSEEDKDLYETAKHADSLLYINKRNFKFRRAEEECADIYQLNSDHQIDIVNEEGKNNRDFCLSDRPK